MILTTYIRESVTFTIPLTDGESPFEPGDDWSLIFTVKKSLKVADSEAVIQKQSGAGITIDGTDALVSLVPDDTSELEDFNLYFDVRGQHIVTGARKTLARGSLRLTLDVGREPEVSIPVLTTEPPVPFATTAAEINAATEKAVPANGDRIPTTDSEDGFSLKWFSWETIQTIFFGDATTKANSAQAAAIQRANHTGTQATSTISGLDNALAARSLISDIRDNLTSNESNKPLSAAQGVVLKAAIDAITTLLGSDETTLDTLQEIVDFIQLNREDLDALTISSIAGLVDALAAKETPAGAQAKADAAQAFAIQRANHTGTQAIATVTGLQSKLDSLGDFRSVATPPLAVIVGDSTADWFMPTSATDPPHYTSSPFVAIKNAKTWPARLEKELHSRGPVDFVNLAVAGRRLYDINETLYDAEITPYLPTDGQDATLIICAGHNDFNFSTEQDPTARATAVYGYATALRTKALADGFTKVIIICPIWYHTHGVRDVVYSTLAAADSAWTHVIDQGYNAGFSVGYADGVHQSTAGHQTLFNRILAVCYDRKNLLTATDLDCGPGGWFPTVRAAMDWKIARRLLVSVRDYRVLGDITCGFTNIADATEANHYGDGVWNGHSSGPNNILLMPGSTLDVQARLNYTSNAPTLFTMRGNGRVTLYSNLNAIETFANIKATISVDEYFVPGGMNWIGQNLHNRSKIIDLTPTSGTVHAIGGLYGDNTYKHYVGPDSLIRSVNTFLINSAGTAGVVVLQNCKFVRYNGGVIENPGIAPGVVKFYPGVTLSNIAQKADSTWTGTPPTACPDW